MDVDRLGPALLEALPAQTAVLDHEGVVVAANQAWARFGAEHPESGWRAGMDGNLLDACEAAAKEGVEAATAVADAVRAVLDGGHRAFHLDARERLEAGDLWFSVRVSRFASAPPGAVVSCTDITARKRAEMQLAHQALHDPLTGLPNRTLFLDRVGLALARLDRRPTTAAVLFLDLDRFKSVNDRWGHEAGDQVIRTVADRLRAALRPGDTAARLGGDEFTVLCEDIAGQADAVAIAERVIGAVAQPLHLGDQEAPLTTSVGIALARGPNDRPEGLLRDADAAMYRAKERGKARWEVFDEGMRTRALERVEVEDALHLALERGELRVHYQPAIDLGAGEVARLEALVRWEHPALGLLPAGHWLPLAEQAGLMVAIGEWVLEQACRQAAAWGRPVAVNVGRRQLTQPGLAATVTATLRAAGIDPSLLWLEFTERTLQHEVDAVSGVLQELRSMGVGVAVDNFGAGWTSLAQLRRSPVDALKIDRSFVADLGAHSGPPQFVEGVVALAHALGIVAVAEGVETQGQLDAVRAAGCDIASGYHIGRPVPPTDIRL